MYTLLTLNLWGYKDWENRLNNITNFISEINPDIVALQEVQHDDNFSKISQSQAIAELAKYKYQVFIPARKKPSIAEDGTYADHGLAILSEFKITKTRSILLEKHLPEHEQCSALYAQIETDTKLVDICNVHFHNTDKTSLLHLNEVLDFFKKQNTSPIMLGDFNVYGLSKYKKLLTDYTLSTECKEYSSFVRDGGTLDYIIAPSDQYTITKVGTSKSYVSDHKAVWAQINPI